MDALIVLGFLAFIAWRERAHAVERDLLTRRRGGRPVPAPVASSQRRERPARRARVISAEDDKAFNAKKDGEASPGPEHGGVSEDLRDTEPELEEDED